VFSVREKIIFRHYLDSILTIVYDPLTHFGLFGLYPSSNFNKTRHFGSRLYFHLHARKAPNLVDALDRDNSQSLSKVSTSLCAFFASYNTQQGKYKIRKYLVDLVTDERTLLKLYIVFLSCEIRARIHLA
jgi:hypothetical protein